MPLLLSPGPEFISALIFLGFHSGFTMSRQTFSSLRIVSLLRHRERERESSATIKKYAQKFPLQSNLSIFETARRKIRKVLETHTPLSRERETETLRKSRIEINHSGEESEIKIKSRRRSGDISFLETIFRTLHHPFLIGHAPNFYSPFIPLISRPVS